MYSFLYHSYQTLKISNVIFITKLHQTWNCFLDILRGLNILTKSVSMSLVMVTDLLLHTHQVMLVIVRRRFHAVVSTLQDTDQPHTVKMEKDKAIMILIN